MDFVQDRAVFTLLVLSGDEVVEDIPLFEEGEYLIGRSESCHITVNMEGLSRQHLSVKYLNGELAVKDISSTGTLINGDRLVKNEPHSITGEAEIVLGNVLHIRVSVSTSEESTVLNIQETNSHPEQTIDNMLPLIKQTGRLTVGRSEKCDIVIASLQVSRVHAILEYKNNALSIEDQNTTNGTYVNGELIQGKAPLKTIDQITIGSTTFVIDGGKLDVQHAIIARGIEKKFSSGFVGLNKMDLKIEKNSFVALMGPSGCGKSTLLKCLNGASPITSGKVIIQGLALNNANFNTLKKHIGYVPQDDIVHRELSVEKTLFYAAKLRMAKDVSNREINQKIDQVLCSLNLDASTIRKHKISELSGGQRKRISIAVELLNDPTILFLDEPTSPLDPETIGDFLTCVQGLVAGGQTVIMVTHKPSDLDYVDKVIFLSKGGYQTFFGKKQDVLPYFSTDNIIEVYAKMKQAEEGIVWNARWRQENPSTEHVDTAEPLQPKQTNSLIRQYYWLSARYFNIKWNDSWNLALLVSQPLLIALLLVFIFQELQLSVLFMMSISAVWFGVSNASKEIVSELAIYERERMFNLNIGNYILSKVTILSIVALLQVLIFVSITYFAYGIRDGDVRLWQFQPSVWFLFFLSVSSTLFGLFLSSIFSNTEKVMTFVPIALMPQIMLAGIIARIDSDVKLVLSYFTLGRWGTEGLAHIQDESARALGHWADAEESQPASVMQMLPVPPNSQTPEEGAKMALQSSGAVDQLGFYSNENALISVFPEDIWGVIIALCCLNAVFTAGIYVALKRKDSRFI